MGTTEPGAPRSEATRARDPAALSATISEPVHEGALDFAYAPRTRTYALVAVLLFSFIGALTITWPILVPIVIGAVMAISTHRAYGYLSARFGGRTRLAAAVVTIVSGLLLAVGGFLVILALTNELVRVVDELRAGATESDGLLARFIGPRTAHAIEHLGVDPARVVAWAQRELEAAATFAAATAALVVRTASEAVLALVVALLTMYYLLRDGAALQGRIERIAPLDPRHTRALIAEAREVGRTAFIGTLATAIVQGALAGIGYAILGVPQPVTWAVVTMLGSFLPVIGTVVVWGPITVYLFVEGHPVRAVLLLAWGIVVVTSLADYVIRPRIVGRRGHGHPLLTLVALLGGIKVFGLPGLIIAPILMSLFVAALRIYEREFGAAAAPASNH